MPGWQLDTVISGGQSGADQGGIAAARFLHYTTGGRAPKGFMTEDGPAGWLAEFGLHAGPVDSLKSRTYHNVIHSDGTIIFTKEVLEFGDKATRRAYFKKARAAGLLAKSPTEILASYGVSGGSLYTAELCIAHRKHMIVNPSTDEELRQWIYNTQVKVANVAGSRESKAPGIFRWVYDFLLEGLVPF